MVFTILRTRPRKNCFFQSINQAVVCSAMLPISRAGYDAHEAPTLLLTGLWRPPHGRRCPPASCRARPAGGAAQSGRGPPQRGGGNTALARRSFAKVPAQFLPPRCPAGHHRLARQPAAPPGSLVEVSATESRGECRGRGDGGPGPQPSAPPASARSALAAWPRPGAGGLLPASRPSPGSAPRAAGGGRSPSTAGPGSLRRGCAAACRGSVRRLGARGRALAVSGPDRVRSPLPACPRPLAAPSGLGRPPLGKVTFRFVSAPRWRANRSPLAFLLFPTAYLFLWREKVS